MQLNQSNETMSEVIDDFLHRDISVPYVVSNKLDSIPGSMSTILNTLRHVHGISCFPLTVKLVAEQQKVELHYPLHSHKLVSELTNWQCQNFNLSEINELKQSIVSHYQRHDDVVGLQSFLNVMSQECVSHKGMAAFYATHWQVKQPVILVAEPCLEKWKESTELLGFGSTQIINLPLDHDAVLDIDSTDRLLDRALNKNIPILLLVGVMGNDEASNRNSKKDLNERQQHYKSQGLDVFIHIEEQC